MASNLAGRHVHEIIIGIDFGTTCSGVAWAYSGRPDRIRVIQDWPNHAGRFEASGKVPTKLRYTEDGDLEWGFQTSPDIPHDDVLEHFKLALDSEHINNLPDGTKLIKGNLQGQDIDRLVTDYLKCLCMYIMKHLRRRIGDVIVETSSFQYVLTVPAIWNDRAKQRTMDAFERAMDIQGQNSVITITEPEAAATCVIQNLPKQLLKEDDCLIVVDAGGGTVDLISYQIRGIHPSLSVSEAAQGSGGACGAAFLNDRFKQMLIGTLGQEDGFGERIIQQCLDKWERMGKRRLCMGDLPFQEYNLPVTELEDNRSLKVRRNNWLLPSTKVFRIFDAIVLQVLRLVTDQRVATGHSIKAVLLVGGFGQSTYLRQRLESHMGPDIPVLQPQNAWTAVVEGAVMNGLAQVDPERIAVNRRARKHYGFELSVAWSPKVHQQLKSKRRWDGYHARWEVDVMQWFIKKGDLVTESQPFSKDFTIPSRVQSGRPNISVNILSDKDSRIAPLAKNDNVKTLCAIEADLSHIPDDQIMRRQGVDGMMYYLVECKIEICCELAPLWGLWPRELCSTELRNIMRNRSDLNPWPDNSASTSYRLVHNGK